MAPRESCFWNAFAPADGTCAARCHEGDLGTSRLKGRLAGKLHHCDVSAEGRSDGFFGCRATTAGFWRRPVLLLDLDRAMRAGARSQGTAVKASANDAIGGATSGTLNLTQTAIGRRLRRRCRQLLRYHRENLH
jgi:hypothetical protein